MMGGDVKSSILKELQKYLESKDDEDLSMAMKPKDASMQVVKIDGGDDSMPDASDGKSPGVMGGDDDSGDKPEMSDEELQELLEALQSASGS